MAYCSGFGRKLHPAVAFVGSDCPVCVALHAPGGHFGASATIDDLKKHLVQRLNPWPPAGRLTLDEYFLKLLEQVSARSTCVRRAVGAIITDERGHILSTGYNGVPSGVEHCTDSPCPGARDPAGDTTRCRAIHAEANALLQCYRLDAARVLYVSCTPCFQCAKLIANTDIKRVVALTSYPDESAREVLTSLKGVEMIVAKR